MHQNEANEPHSSNKRLVASQALARERHKNFRARQLRATCHEQEEDFNGFQVEIVALLFLLALKSIRTFWMVQKLKSRSNEQNTWDKS